MKFKLKCLLRSYSTGVQQKYIFIYKVTTNGDYLPILADELPVFADGQLSILPFCVSQSLQTYRPEASTIALISAFRPPSSRSCSMVRCIL